MKSASLALILLWPMASFAATIGEEDNMVINRLTDTDFEVVQTHPMGAAGFWCGAATFIERRNGLSELTPIYLRRGPGPSVTEPGRRAVVFSTSNAGLPPAVVRRTVSVDRPGDMIKSVHARRFCRDTFTRSTK